MVSWRRHSKPITPSTSSRHSVKRQLGPHVERVQLDDRGVDEVLQAVAAFLEKRSSGSLTIELDRMNGRAIALVRIGSGEP